MGKIVGVMGVPYDPKSPWDALLDWMGREGKHHMPENTSLRQHNKGELPGDHDPDTWFSLILFKDGEQMEANPGDWVVRLSDGTYETRKEHEIQLCKQPGSNGTEIAFIDNSDPQ